MVAKRLMLLLLLVAAPAALADDWPQWRGPDRDGVWKETGLLQKFASEQIPVKWRAPVSSGYTGPTVAAGRVYLMDRRTQPAEGERILCFDAATGQPV
ncbi:MAG: hypothetical protein NTX87_20930 [Planctomycetota bacterium]|nr:hypothetical protein [Planctomycetota bacterium]